jgi:hypothetical protein
MLTERAARKARPWPGIMAVMLVVAACQGGGGGDEVADFSEIAAEGPVIEFDSSGTIATLGVTTTIDAVCAVTYGTDAELGQIATDDDMSGGPHREHRVRMTGLQPDTEYVYRLQGVGGDGRLYRSELMRFRTPPQASAGEPPGVDVAIGATVLDVSSEFSAAFAAANAVDGDPATEWSTRGDGDDAYVVIDLGRVVDVVAVGFHTRTMADGSATTDTFTMTVDGHTTYGPFPVGRADVSFTGRVVRFDVHVSTGGNTGASRIEVFEAP